MLCEPLVNVDVETEAWPKPSSTAVPKLVTPSKNSTNPLGVPPEDVTVAVKVTLSPVFDGLSDEARAVFVANGVTVKFTHQLVSVDVPPPMASSTAYSAQFPFGSLPP